MFEDSWYEGLPPWPYHAGSQKSGDGFFFFLALKEGITGGKGAWRWLVAKGSGWAIKAREREVQTLVLWEVITELASMHGLKGFQSAGKRTTRRKGLFPCSLQGELWDLCLTSTVPQPSEGLLMQIRAVFHMYDPEISFSRVNLKHERYNVMS